MEPASNLCLSVYFHRYLTKCLWLAQYSKWQMSPSPNWWCSCSMMKKWWLNNKWTWWSCLERKGMLLESLNKKRTDNFLLDQSSTDFPEPSSWRGLLLCSLSSGWPVSCSKNPPLLHIWSPGLPLRIPRLWCHLWVIFHPLTPRLLFGYKFPRVLAVFQRGAPSSTEISFPYCNSLGMKSVFILF